MIHNKKQIAEDLSDQNVVIYGHSHKYHEEYKNGQLWLNPGCCGYRKPSQPITLAILAVENDQSIIVHHVDIAAPEIHSSLIYSRTQLIAVSDNANVLKLRLRVRLIGTEKR